MDRASLRTVLPVGLGPGKRAENVAFLLALLEHIKTVFVG
jgi:hypothetical protein